jgi:integrase
MYPLIVRRSGSIDPNPSTGRRPLDTRPESRLARRYPPKTRAGRRSVPIPPVAVDALGRRLGETLGSPTDHLFTAPAGGPVRASGWRRRIWAPAVRRADLEGLRPHDLRHTAVALWIAAGASPNEIAARAGHASVVTVLDRYGHLLPSGAELVNSALDELAASARTI